MRANVGSGSAIPTKIAVASDAWHTYPDTGYQRVQIAILRGIASAAQQSR